MDHQEAANEAMRMLDPVTLLRVTCTILPSVRVYIPNNKGRKVSVVGSSNTFLDKNTLSPNYI
jgi:hypothetical protein